MRVKRLSVVSTLRGGKGTWGGAVQRAKLIEGWLRSIPVHTKARRDLGGCATT